MDFKAYLLAMVEKKTPAASLSLVKKEEHEDDENDDEFAVQV